MDNIRTNSRSASTAFSDVREKMLTRVLGHLHTGHLTIQFPSGNVRTFHGSQSNVTSMVADMTIHSWTAISRMMKTNDIGLGESYMDGSWSTNDLSSLLNLLCANLHALEKVLSDSKLWQMIHKFIHLFNRNSKKGSRRNISYHYDLGNDFYELWLDETMTYSSAFRKDGEADLATAQTEKYRQLAEQLGLKRSDHVLEIGCGWGGFAEFAIKEYGCHVTGLTLSTEQKQYAEKRLANKGLKDKADFLLQDYRDMEGQFDHIVSIEMLEAVGQEYWPTYFQQVNHLLKPGGKIGIQVITIDHDRFDHYSSTVDFIQKYIFPGGMLPSHEIMQEQLQSAHLTMEKATPFGLDYAWTLKKWQDTFMAKLGGVKQIGFDDRFIRMWQFYLAYCEAGFTQKSIDVYQYIAQK